MAVPKTVLPNGVSTPEQIFAQINERYAPVRYEVPDYDHVVELTMLTAGEEEHCQQYARMADGSRNSDAFVRLYVAYALVEPKLAEDRNKRVQAEKVAAVLEGFPSDWLSPVFLKANELTVAYAKKRQEREREGSDGNMSFFPKRTSAPSSSGTDSGSS